MHMSPKEIILYIIYIIINYPCTPKFWSIFGQVFTKSFEPMRAEKG